ncbi:MAG: helix-turn-helix transcriptional regulator [Clostridiaceae bacterium]|jgi:transcriptional regulator with XRE-family HTH domain|nr:helix-turn-helix transcriptional regulator [Clostridiaceae bacterium]
MRSKIHSAHAQQIVPEREAIQLGHVIEKHCHNHRRKIYRRGYTHLSKTRLTCQSTRHTSCHATASKTKHHPAQDTASTWLGYIIRHERRRQNLTQTQLTAALQFGSSALSTIENGRAFANIERTFRVIQHLQLDVATIVVAVRAQLTFHTMLPEFRRQEAAARAHFPKETPQTLPQWKVRVAEEPLDKPYGLREP